MTKQNLLEKVVSLCKRRGFVYPNSEIYGGLANAYDYGPLGVELLRNIKDHWWRTFVHDRENIYGIDGAIVSNPKVWEASGHTESFADSLVECRSCHQRFRVDQLENSSKCPECGGEFTEPRMFSGLFKTFVGAVEDSSSVAYLRPETAQNMFLCFQNVVDSFSPRLPFGIAQIGKAFRNEVTAGQFIFRTLEFEQMEIEYFVREENWEKHFEEWKKEMMSWLVSLGVSEKKLRWRQHMGEELSHYSKRTEDVEYEFPFGGFKELYGLAYRTDYDLKQHSEHSGVDLRYRDQETGEEFFPHVVEPTFGVTRTALTVLLDAYCEEEKRVVLKLKPQLAPYKVAVFPLLANKPKLVKKAREVFEMLRVETGHAPSLPIVWDDRGNIGKRYYSQDEIGTPWCVTIDFDTLKDNTVTVRDRDTTEQERIAVSDLKDHFFSKLNTL